MTLNLPLHPSKVHPLTGEPLRAIGFRRDGRVIWPIMGGAPDDGDAAAKAATDAVAAQAATKAAEDAAAKAATDAAANSDKSDDGKGFPANTPVAQMKPEEQAAYHLHQSRKHEGRATAYHQAVGGKSPEEVKAALEEAEKIRQQSLSEQERAVEEARKAGQQTAAGELGTKSVRAAFDLLLGDAMEKDALNSEIDVLDLSKFLTDSGDVDTAKVRAHAQKIAPSGKGTGNTSRQSFDFGGGRGGDGQSTGGSVAEVMAARRAAREGKTS